MKSHSLFLITRSELDAIVRQLPKKSPERKSLKKAAKDADDVAEDHAQYRAAAKEEYQEDGKIEIDDGAIVSHNSDGSGAYVQAWVWVARD